MNCTSNNEEAFIPQYIASSMFALVIRMMKSIKFKLSLSASNHKKYMPLASPSFQSYCLGAAYRQ